MSVATPKSQAKSPIQLDVIFICQKRSEDLRPIPCPTETLEQATNRATSKLRRLAERGFVLSENDCRVTVFSQFIAALGPVVSPDAAVQAFAAAQNQLDDAAQTVAITLAEPGETESANAEKRQPQQLPLFT